MEKTFCYAKLGKRKHMTAVMLSFNGVFEPQNMQYLHVLKQLLAACTYTLLDGAAVSVIRISG